MEITAVKPRKSSYFHVSFVSDLLFLHIPLPFLFCQSPLLWQPYEECHVWYTALETREVRLQATSSAEGRAGTLFVRQRLDSECCFFHILFLFKTESGRRLFRATRTQQPELFLLLLGELRLASQVAEKTREKSNSFSWALCVWWTPGLKLVQEKPGEQAFL